VENSSESDDCEMGPIKEITVENVKALMELEVI
jgi:hypothetical protein